MITPIIKVKANIILVTCGLLILMIHMALNQHQSGGRCDRLLQVTLTARFSIDPLSLTVSTHPIHIQNIQNIFISTSKSFFSLPLYPYTHPLHPKHIHLNIYFLCSTGSNTLQSCDYPPGMFGAAFFCVGGEEEDIFSDEQVNSQKTEGSAICPCVNAHPKCC